MKTAHAPLVTVGLVLALSGSFAAQGGEDFARRQYESGLAFLQNGRYAEALKDFQVVVDSFAQSAVADDALMQIALHQLDIAHDLAAAQAATDKLLKDYPNSDSAPMAYVITGRLTMAKGKSPAEVEAALASFERVPRLFPGSDAVAAARFYAGDALRLARRMDEATDRFRRVAMEFPRSIWGARADLAMVAVLVASDRAQQAFPRLQRIRQQFPGAPEAATALAYNTLLYRLYIRNKSPYAFSGRFVGSESNRFRDVLGVSIDDAGRIMLGQKQGVAIFDERGTFVRTISAADAQSFFVDPPNRVVIVREAAWIPDGGAAISIGVPQVNRLPRPVENMPAVVALSNGDRLIVDQSTKTVMRYSPAGKFISNFASVNARRLARSPLDDVAMIDRDSKSVLLFDRDGKPTGKVGAQFGDPLDVTFDALGHLYVLDGGKATVSVFGPRNRLLATIAAPGKTAGALQKPKAFALDVVGRMYVFDEGSQRIQVYQ